ncbi:MAG: hypothetical protein KUG49_02830 [Dokdonia sp.]|jgi:hypothetical protein|nr:hypothetical protein [Dokdonia sp.]
MSPLTKRIVFSFILLLANISVFAQHTATPPAPQRTPPVGLPMPIDGGVFVLLVLGGALGIWFYVQKNRSAKAI